MIKSPHLIKLKASHQYQGKTNNCGPYCAAITAKALGHQEADGLNFTTTLSPFRWKGPLPVFQRVPNSATMPWGTTHLLQLSQFKTRWKPFASEKDLLANLQNNLVQIIIIGEWRPTWAHYMIFVAYDALKGFGFVDPAFENGTIHWYDPAEFSKLWRNYGKILIKAYPSA